MSDLAETMQPFEGHGATLDGDRVTHFGDPAGEHTRARKGAGLFSLAHLGRLGLVGGDAADYLHRLLSYDIKAMPEGGLARPFLMSSTGRIEMWMSLMRLSADRFITLLPAGQQDHATALIDRFLFAEDVELVDERPMWAALSLQGGDLTNVAAALSWPELAPGTHTPITLAGHEVQVAHHNRLGRLNATGYDLLVPQAGLSAVIDALLAAGATLAGDEALQALRVEGGAPDWGEYGPESNPLEVSGLAGITDGKGCYPGQEVIEMTIARGRPPRRLIGLALSASAEPTAEVTLNGKTVGKLTSVAVRPDGQALALALVRSRIADGGPFLVDGHPAELRPVAPDFTLPGGR